MKKKLLSVVLASAMLTGTLAGWGSGASGTAPADNGGSADAGTEAAAGDAASDDAQTEEGKVINIYSFNDELRTRITAVYPAIENTSDDGTVSTLNDGGSSIRIRMVCIRINWMKR